MQLCSKARIAVAMLTLALPVATWAANCTTQAALLPQDRNALAAAGSRLANAVVQQDFTTLQAALLPSEAGDWNNIREVVDQAGPVVKGGQAQIRNLYLLDSTTQANTADTQFFCFDASGSLTVTITMAALPPGRYAVILADSAGASLGGQIGLILAWDTTSTPAWKLGGVSVRPGILDGHDGKWFWTVPANSARSASPGPPGTARRRPLPSSAGRLPFLAQPREAGERTSANQGLTGQGASRFLFPAATGHGRSTHLRPLAPRTGPWRNLRVHRRHRSSRSAHLSHLRPQCVFESPAWGSRKLSWPLGVRRHQRQNHPGHGTADGANTLSARPGIQRKSRWEVPASSSFIAQKANFRFQHPAHHLLHSHFRLPARWMLALLGSSGCTQCLRRPKKAVHPPSHTRASPFRSA